MLADSVRMTARKIGLLYFVSAVLMMLNESLISTGFFVANDPAATAQNIIASEFKFRLGILTTFVGQCLSIFVVVGLYDLFRIVDRRQAILMLVLSLVGTSLMLSILPSKLLTLTLLSGADFLSGFTGAQLDTYSFILSKLRVAGTALVLAFWGLWLFPFGILVIRSKMLPRILGYCLFAAGIGYVINSLAFIILPDHTKLISQITLPLYFGELPIIIWLFIKGAKVPEPGIA